MNDDLAQIFHEELRDLLESLDRALLDLKADPGNAALIDQVFRDLHTIKGNGGMFGFTELTKFVHEFETAFERIRSGKATATSDVIKLALAARDEIPRLVNSEADTDGRRQAILTDLALAIGGSDSKPVAKAEARVHQEDVKAPVGGKQSLRFQLSGTAFEFGVRPELLLAEIEGLGGTEFECDVRQVAELSTLDVSSCDLIWTCTLPSDVGRDMLEDVFLFVEAEWVLTTEDEEADPPKAITEKEKESEKRVAPAPTQTSAVAKQRAAEAAPTPQANTQATVRVPADRLDSLMDAVGELVIIEARLTQLARESRDSALMATAEQITRLAAGLRDATMTMRMVPMRTLVGRFRRLVAELSDSLGKPADFVVMGEDTELDKTLIEKLADPIVHLLRNSLDHGIESAAERIASGKSTKSTIELSAAHAGTEVLVSIRDDGRGLNAERIREKAISMGLISSEVTLTDQQIHQLIFEPGFSTAQTITQLSGRGVGMDVVRRTIDSLRGRIDVISVPGQGTTVTLRMPLTLAIIEGLLIEVEGERYTLPMGAVQEIVELPQEKEVGSRSGDFLDIRGQFVPFLRLRNVFDCAGTAPKKQNVVIVNSVDTRVGIVVDRIIGTNQVVIKQMSKLHSAVRSVSGATIMGDGSVALILDVSHLVSLARSKAEIPTSKQEVVA